MRATRVADFISRPLNFMRTTVFLCGRRYFAGRLFGKTVMPFPTNVRRPRAMHRGFQFPRYDFHGEVEIRLISCCPNAPNPRIGEVVLTDSEPTDKAIGHNAPAASGLTLKYTSLDCGTPVSYSPPPVPREAGRRQCANTAGVAPDGCPGLRIAPFGR